MKDLFIKSNRYGVSFRETSEAYDEVPQLRTYCTQFPSRFNLQIRGSVPLETERGHKTKPRNLIATISLSKDEIIAIAEYVKNYGPDIAEAKADADQEKHDKYIQENFEENGDPKEHFE